MGKYPIKFSTLTSKIRSINDIIFKEGVWMIAQVILDIAHEQINTVYDYFIKPVDIQHIKKGMRVMVPFGTSDTLRMAFVYNIIETSDSAKKYVEEVIDIKPIVDDEFFILFDALTQDPNVLISDVMQTLLPKIFWMSYQQVVQASDLSQIPDEFVHKFNKRLEWVIKDKDKSHLYKLKKLEQQGIVTIKRHVSKRNIQTYETWIELKEPEIRKNDSQLKIIQHLLTYGNTSKKELLAQYSKSSIQWLIDHEAIKEFLVEKRIDHHEFNRNQQIKTGSNISLDNQPIDLSKHQIYALKGYRNESIELRNQIFNQVLSQGKKIFIMVPERFMIETTKDALIKNFPNELWIELPSELSDKELYLRYNQIEESQEKIIIGNKKALFTQMHHLGLIYIVDANDSTHQTFEGLYYDAVELAKLKGRHLNIPICLEADTYSVSVYQDILNGNVVDLSEDLIDDEKDITIVDMKKELMEGHTKMISRYLEEEIRISLLNHQKVLLILNHKSYAPFVMCRTCSYVPKDPETGIALNYSEKNHMLYSHMTKHQEPFQKTCPVCGKPTIKSVGSGLEQLEKYIKELFPLESILRVDQDSLSNRKLYQYIMNDSKERIVIGTQMALKTSWVNTFNLVGILMADQWLKVPRYQAYEDSYLMLKKSKQLALNHLVIQTYDPLHFVIKDLNKEVDFYQEELSNRKISKLPPFRNLLQIKLLGMSYLKTYQHAFVIKEKLTEMGLQVLGPAQSVKLKENQRYQVLLTVKYQLLEPRMYSLLKSNEQIKIKIVPDIIWY